MRMNSQPTSFYWHDYETFGLNPENRFPAQFAGLRTDLELNQTGEPEALYCRPNADTLPEPASCLLTGILPQYCEEHGLSEEAFAHAVFERLAHPGTIGIGYNTMKFDDEVTRFLFWRNFLPPYSREFSNGCGRWDLFPLTLAIWTLRPEGIVWPLNRDWLPKLEEKRLISGHLKPSQLEGVSFRLECLTAANGITHEHAHDALSDVYGTLELARLFRAKQPRLLSWAFAHRTKAEVQKALSDGPVIWVDSKNGQSRGFIRCVIAVGAMPGSPNTALVWDLSANPEELFSLSSEDLARRFLHKKEDAESGLAPLPLFSLKVNQSPFVCSDFRVLRASRAEEIGLDLARVHEHSAMFTAQRLAETASLIADAFPKTEEAQEPGDADTALYRAGFPSRSDENAVNRISATDGEDLGDLAGKLVFDNPLYEELLFRYRARNFPETLTESEKTRWQSFLNSTVPGKIASFDEAFAALLPDIRMSEKAAEIVDALQSWKQRLQNRVQG